jgi:transposase
VSGWTLIRVFEGLRALGYEGVRRGGRLVPAGARRRQTLGDRSGAAPRLDIPPPPWTLTQGGSNAVLDEAGFEREVEGLCAAHYASGVGRPSVPPGRYVRMLFVGYFESLESERGIAWRCADSLSLRQFLKLGTSEAVPDHNTLARTRARLPLEIHDAVFALVLRLVAEHGLVKGRRVGVDASTMEADAAMRSIIRREDGAGWQAMLGELARTSGIATPTTDQLRQLDRTRTGKRVSNAD